MNDEKNGLFTPRKIRKDVIGGNVVDQKFKFSTEDLNTFLSGWERVVKNYKIISNELSQTLFTEHPGYLELFQSSGEETERDFDFSGSEELYVTHSRAVLKGINTMVENLTAKYEEDNEILPIIGNTHMKRGVTVEMMKSLKECLIETCSNFLKLHKSEVAAWDVVLEFIFQDYLCKLYPKEEEKPKASNFSFY